MGRVAATLEPIVLTCASHAQPRPLGVNAQRAICAPCRGQRLFRAMALALLSLVSAPQSFAARRSLDLPIRERAGRRQ